jgi:hypothetical protein
MHWKNLPTETKAIRPTDDQQEAAVVLHLFTYLILKTELLSENGHEILSLLFDNVEPEYHPLADLLLKITSEYRNPFQ